MNTALSELRELERQSSAKHAPDVVLDTLEQLKSGGGGVACVGVGGLGGGVSEPSSPLHSRLLREADAPNQHPLQRSASSASDMPSSTFRPGKGGAGPKSPLLASSSSPLSSSSSPLSSSSSGLSSSSFREGRPPATRPKPVVFPKSGGSSGSGGGAMGSPTTSIPPTPPPPPPPADKSCPV
ncbi:SLIT-ROBO Rho GTPase-activating protein 2-like [Sardina pilchardus]|uniref:SLIT-ROBO Rho GTPase-activating protein 2-like n=1 Tax=Sardina pilchardus TaxID=27697 RepID=UPI002E0E1FFE